MSKQYVSAANARQAASAHGAIHPAMRAAPPPISAPGSSEPAAVLIIGSLEEGVDTIVGPFPSSEAAPMWCATPPGQRGRPGQRPVQVGDRCFAWVAEGIVRFLSDEAGERDYQIVEDPSPFNWTEERGSGAFLYAEYAGTTHPVSLGDVITLIALRRAGEWVTSAAVCGERSDLADSSSDRLASSLGDLVNAGLGRAQTEPGAARTAVSVARHGGGSNRPRMATAAGAGRDQCAAQQRRGSRAATAGRRSVMPIAQIRCWVRC